MRLKVQWPGEAATTLHPAKALSKPPDSPMVARHLVRKGTRLLPLLAMLLCNIDQSEQSTEPVNQSEHSPHSRDNSLSQSEHRAKTQQKHSEIFISPP